MNTNPTPFKASIRPTLNADAQKLVDVYNATYGSTAPGCCPEALAAVFKEVFNTFRDSKGDFYPDDLVSTAYALEGKA